MAIAMKARRRRVHRVPARARRAATRPPLASVMQATLASVTLITELGKGRVDLRESSDSLIA